MVFISLSLMILSITLVFLLTGFAVKIEKIGIPLFWNDVKWTWFVFRNFYKSEMLDTKHFKVKDYIIVFNAPWLFYVYKGKSVEEIRHKYSLGGQSNEADYLTFWQKIIGKKIENMYFSRTKIKKQENIWNY